MCRLLQDCLSLGPYTGYVEVTNDGDTEMKIRPTDVGTRIPRDKAEQELRWTLKWPLVEQADSTIVTLH